MKTKMFLLLSAVFVALPAFVAAQDDEPYSEQVTITAPYQPSIQDARKIDIAPELKVQEPEKKTVEYNITPQKISMDVELEPMQAVRVKSGEKELLKSNYIRGGIGNYKTAYGELFTTSKQSRDHRIGLHLKHMSHGGDVKDYATALNSQNLAEVFGEKYYKESSLYGKGFFNRDVLHHYGFLPADYAQPFTEDDIRQQFTTFGGEVRYENLDKQKDEFDYQVGMKFYGWRDDYQSLENAAHLHVFAEQPAEVLEAIDFQSFAIDGGFQFYNSGDSLKAINTVNMNIKPYFEIKNGFYRLQAGANLSTVMSDETDPAFTVFPHAKAWIHMVPGYLTITGAVTGNKEHQSFRKLSSENPFIKPYINREYTTNKIDTYGALTGNIARGFDFSLKVNYLEASGYPLFVNDFTKTFDNQFEMIYEDLSILTYGGAVSVVAADRLQLDASVRYNTYSTEAEIEAWHLPELEIDASAVYTPQMKMPLNFRIKATSLSGRYAKDNAGNAVELDDIIDLGFEVHYEHSSSLGAFIELNNILAQNQPLWYNYPSYGFNALAGVSYSF
jgi:hypothetical protein